jgi:phosphatidylglycerol lysyltransferase
VTGAVTVAQLAGLVSHVPGGVGVFEGLVVLFLRPEMSTGSLVSALVAFRLVYYILPLAIALAVLLIDEAHQRRTRLTRWSRTCRALAGWAAPPMMAFFTFAAGVVLLCSSATPAVPERLAWMAHVVPLPLLELSHFTASLTGLLLLLLAQGIAGRIDAAYYVTVVALAVGSVASLLKGGDYEEAILLLLMLVALLGGRRHFTRRARAFERPLSAGWLAAVMTAVAAAIWLGFFAYQHVAYTNALWWQFAIDAEAPRFLRAAVAVTIGALFVSIRRLFRPALPRRNGPSDADTAAIDRVVAGQTRATSLLVHLGDKSILWNHDRTAFLMYATRGKSAVALGDPVGPSACAPELIRAFIELADRFALTPVFYEVSRRHMSHYADSGLISLKIGEEARVALHTFSLSGGAHKALRASLNRMTREGFTFRVVDAPLVPMVIDELGEVSDDWLAAKNATEKGFSLGYFSEPYLLHFPVALIERGGRIEAFANLWLGSRNVEVSVDLMRYRRSAPPGVMDALFAHTMLWAQERGYRWFNLGMAPLAGLSVAPATHAWSRLGHFVYRHGEGFYNFQGLRAYKAKFNPIWEPRYIVYPGGLSLPRVLADVTALVGGGYIRMLRRAGRRAA